MNTLQINALVEYIDTQVAFQIGKADNMSEGEEGRREFTCLKAYDNLREEFKDGR